MDNNFDVNVLTEAWLGLDKIYIYDFQIVGHRAYSTIINKTKTMASYNT
jgi:hypothetical protein